MIQYSHFQEIDRGTVAMELPSIEKLFEIENRFKEEKYVSFAIKAGFSICNDADGFEKKVGREIADSRMELRPAIAYNVTKKQVQTKQGFAEKTTIDCVLPFIVFNNKQVSAAKFQISHIGNGSEPRLSIDDSYIIALAYYERRKGWK